MNNTRTHEQIRDEHYYRLNNYRNSREYHVYRDDIGDREARNPDEFPSLFGVRWQIDEELYDDFLGMLPPLGWRGGVFYMREFTFDDITTKFTKEGDTYFCEFARYPNREEC